MRIICEECGNDVESVCRSTCQAPVQSADPLTSMFQSSADSWIRLFAAPQSYHSHIFFSLTRRGQKGQKGPSSASGNYCTSIRPTTESAQPLAMTDGRSLHFMTVSIFSTLSSRQAQKPKRREECDEVGTRIPDPSSATHSHNRAEKTPIISTRSGLAFSSRRVCIV